MHLTGMIRVAMLCAGSVATASLAQDELSLAEPGEGSALERMDTGDQTRGWEAVGRLDMGKRSFCTGALIAPQLVLTAAHCMFDPSSGERVDDGEIEFLAGWRNGRALAYRKVRRSVVHPAYSYGTDSDIERVAHDLALVELDQPILLGQVTPFETDERPRKGDEVGVVSYGRGRDDAPSLQQTCEVMARQQGILMLSCNVDFGSSGAPVFVIRDGVARIVSVISSMSAYEGKKISIATSLGDNLVEVRASLEAADATEPQRADVRTISGGGGGGAKFVKPEGDAGE